MTALKLGSQQEFSSFMDVGCVNCDHPISLKVEGWAVEVRHQSIATTSVIPSQFVCEYCSTANEVKLVYKVELETVVCAPVKVV